KVWRALNEAGKSVKGSDVLVLGVADKPEIDDVRESPALDIIALLQEAGANVSYHDPYVPQLRVPSDIMQSDDLTPERLQSTDAVVIATNHRAIDYHRLIQEFQGAVI